ncbi:hypothetical protein HG535_0D04970 [Zygotorulaspora mrakii]|uniref:Major facilitator superfamily (MFS) profile domain-containing protein n=1 Tax=Zygotorulaspora mrakii TaxID=42260 RepID=A0A7H9B2A4_ZYGMR|nr:uncharacterized protein HG535_0D04970 [Zygotorulaspora mrakii]QLG72788.1 hypothetical protein HG535_0D04970 [Zygotorulaspora mrakii]
MTTNSSDNKHIDRPWLRDIPFNSSELRDRLIDQPWKEITLFKSQKEHTDGAAEGSGASGASDFSAEESDSKNEDKGLRYHISGGSATSKGSRGLGKYWAIITTGAGLFSDGYINNSISTVSTCLSTIYGAQYTESRAIQNVSSIAFAGTVIGQLTFGYLADYYSRKMAMLTGTSLLILFSILCAGAWGVGTTGTQAGGLFAAITAYRFFLGIAIGSEYSSSSPAAAEASNMLPSGKRNRYFCWFTNMMIDLGFVVSAFVPLVLLWICGERHLTPVWRITIGLGAIPPISLFFLRLRYRESDAFKATRFRKVMPYWRIIKFYWLRLACVSIIWFLYDFSAYAFGTYSSIIIGIVLGDDASLVQTFGWNVVFNLFYMPGAFSGAISADWFGPRTTLTVGLILQAALGFIMAGALEHLRKHIAGFVVVYGIFMTLGEFSAGDNIGLLASKVFAVPVRGQLYGIAAAVGKVGAFVGSYVFPSIIRNAGGFDTTSGLQAPYWVASSLCIFSALVAYLFLPAVDQDASAEEDRRFLEFLKSTGFDLSELGDDGASASVDYSFESSTGSESLIVKENVEEKNIELN